MRIVLLSLDREAAFGSDAECSVRSRALAAALLRAGHEVTAVVAELGEESMLMPVRNAGLQVRLLRTPITEREIDWHLAQTSADCVVEHLLRGSGQGAAAASSAGISHVYDVGFSLDVESARGTGSEGSQLGNMAQAFSRSSGAITPSEATTHWVSSLAPAGFPVMTLPVPAAPEYFTTPDEGQLRELEGRLRFQMNEFRIGCVGGMRPGQDLSMLVQACARIAKEIPLRLLLIGDGPLRNRVLREAHESGVAVTMTGRVESARVPLHLALCDVIAVPNTDGGHEESFPPARMLEAMAASRPAVVASTPSVERLATHGRDALLVPPGDAGAMAEALRHLALDPALRGRLGAAGRRTAESQQDWDSVAVRIVGFALSFRAGARGGQPA